MERWGKVFFLIGLVCLGGFSIISSPVWAKDPEKVLIHADFSPLRSLDPPFVNIAPDQIMCRVIYQSLVRYKFNSSEIEGDLAKSWTVSKDGLVYTFKLRDNILWHKGFGKFTAKDVKYTFDRILDPKTGAPFRSEIADEIKEVRVVDDYTVEFRLNYPCVPFLHKLASPRGSAIVNSKAVEKFGKDYARNPIGTGPFIFESWTREQTVMVANKEFKQREGPPKIDKVIYKIIPDYDTLLMALEKGEIDMAWLVPRDQAIHDRLKASGCKIARIKRDACVHLCMNNKKKPFDDVRVRRAIAHAIDKDSLAKYILSGMGERLDSPIPKGILGYSDKGIPRYDYDPEKAKELLTQAGYPHGFEVNLDTDTSPSRLPIATAITEQLRKINISAKLTVTDQATWFGKYSKGITDFILTTRGLQPDPDFTMMRQYHSSAFSPGLNVSKYDKIDDLIEKARMELDEKKRLKYYYEIQKKIMEDLPDIPLVMQDYPAAYKSYISGVAERDYVWGFDFYYTHYQEKR